MGRLQAIICDAAASIVLATSDVRAQLGRCSNQDVGHAPSWPAIVAVDEVGADRNGKWEAPAIAPDDIAFVQYTSGTTGTPRGVMVTHRQALQNIRNIVGCFGLDTQANGISWLPPYHDMGLVAATLAPVHAGFPVTLMAPAAFLQRPLRWLEALSAERATITTAPNFAWQLCVDAVTDEDVAALDLSSLRFALSGAEPVRAATVAATMRTLSPCGLTASAIRPVYGMAETVLLATAGRADSPARAIDFAASMLGGEAMTVLRRSSSCTR
ncbi:MAG: AMP-binding protein [Pseudomonadota bacterium]